MFPFCLERRRFLHAGAGKADFCRKVICGIGIVFDILIKMPELFEFFERESGGDENTFVIKQGVGVSVQYKTVIEMIFFAES